MPPRFLATKLPVGRQGSPPDSFLAELLQWARTAPLPIFARNDEPDDIFSLIEPTLGPWHITTDEPIPCIHHRAAAMLEAMRVHAGFESSWSWTCGVDTTNAHSVANKTGEETGIFQVSYDSEYIEHHFMQPFADAHGLTDPDIFIAKMKSDHTLSLEYYARLIRIDISWAGPLKRSEILPWLRRAAVQEFKQLLA